MKNRFYLIALLFISCFISSCESDDVDQSDFQNSVIALSDFKKSTNNSYKYVVSGVSWIGTAWKTTIFIVDGKATERHFKYTITQGLGNNMPQGELEWIEKGSEIGTHKNGAPALTLDEIYKKAEQEWLVKRDNVKIYFETKNNGLISICGFVADGCQDDCFVGIRITSIESIQ